jgi:hypothetical protein
MHDTMSDLCCFSQHYLLLVTTACCRCFEYSDDAWYDDAMHARFAACNCNVVVVA